MGSLPLERATNDGLGMLARRLGREKRQSVVDRLSPLRGVIDRAADVLLRGAGTIAAVGADGVHRMGVDGFTTGTASTLDGTLTTPLTRLLPNGLSTDTGDAGVMSATVDPATGDGALTAPSNRWRITHETTSGDAANAVLDMDGLLRRATSSRRYKQDIEDAAIDPTLVGKMRPRTWRDKNEVADDPDTTKRYVGFIAEELHDLGLTQFVGYDGNGAPESVAYDRLSVALLCLLTTQGAALADAQATVEQQTETVAAQGRAAAEQAKAIAELQAAVKKLQTDTANLMLKVRL